MLLFLLGISLIVPGAALASGEDQEGGAPPRTAHPSSEQVKKELTAVIESQLAAFRANDYAKAYTFAAAEIRAIYPLKDFETMVRSGFPAIAKSGAVEFGTALDRGDEAVVNVRVEHAVEKTSVQFRYLLKKEAGGWKITGVVEVKPDGLSV